MESETSKAIMESEVRLKVTEDFEADLKKMEDIYMTSLKNWVIQSSNNRKNDGIFIIPFQNDVAEAQVTEQTSTMNEGEPNNGKPDNIHVYLIFSKENNFHFIHQYYCR